MQACLLTTPDGSVSFVFTAPNSLPFTREKVESSPDDAAGPVSVPVSQHVPVAPNSESPVFFPFYKSTLTKASSWLAWGIAASLFAVSARVCFTPIYFQTTFRVSFPMPSLLRIPPSQHCFPEKSTTKHLHSAGSAKEAETHHHMWTHTCLYDVALVGCFHAHMVTGPHLTSLNIRRKSLAHAHDSSLIL